MVSFLFTKFAEKRFAKLSKRERFRLSEKLKTLKNHDDIFSVLKPLHNFEPATHRLRIGNYRLVMKLERQSGKDIFLLVLDVGHRKDIYR